MKDRKLRAGIALEEVPNLPPVSPLPGVRDLRDEAPGLWTETHVRIVDLRPKLKPRLLAQQPQWPLLPRTASFRRDPPVNKSQKKEMEPQIPQTSP